jgi:hypothetical protein
MNAYFGGEGPLPPFRAGDQPGRHAATRRDHPIGAAF